MCREPEGEPGDPAKDGRGWGRRREAREHLCRGRARPRQGVLVTAPQEPAPTESRLWAKAQL